MGRKAEREHDLRHGRAPVPAASRWGSSRRRSAAAGRSRRSGPLRGPVLD